MGLKENNINLKSTNIGVKKSLGTSNAPKDELFGDDDFKKNIIPDNMSNGMQSILNNKDNLSSETGGEFTNNFDNVEDFESKLNELSSQKKKGSSSLTHLSFNTISENSKKNNEDLNFGKGELDIELQNSILDINNSPPQLNIDYNHNKIEESLNFSHDNLDENNLFRDTVLTNDLSQEAQQQRLEVVVPVLIQDEEISKSGSRNIENLDSTLLTPNNDQHESSNTNKDIGVKRKKYSSIKKEHYKKSVFGNISVKSQYTMFFATLFVGVIGLGSSAFFYYDSNKKESIALKVTTVMGGQSEKFNSNFRESLLGVNGSYKKMSDTWDNLLNLNKTLKSSVSNLKNPKLTEVLGRITDNIGILSKNVEYIKTLESIVKDGSAKKNAIDQKITSLLGLVDKIEMIYIQTGGNQAEITQVNLIKKSFKNISASISAILIGESVNKSMVVELGATKEIIQNANAEVLNGSPAKGINKLSSLATPVYDKFLADWKYLSGDLDEIIKNADALAKAKSIEKLNTATINSLTSDINILSQMYDGNAHGSSKIFKNILMISILLLIISLAGLGYIYRFESKKKERELKNESERNKRSVNKLLNEMVYLQRGNLTRKTTVEEGITLDIADSVNATIDSLVVVVTKIKNSSLVMKEKTNEINLVSSKLLDSTEKQSDSIVEANASINNIAKAINQISEKTKESLITAQNSSEASNLGARQVKESIESMIAISKNMEETMLLMKKVSDSSKQISEVINLLSDITEETNILALNATVQAAKAGEAGKGFKVVADSIQELADNAAEATRRVGALIATVQTDIHSVGSSIERTNKEVERGVELSENAGGSLSEITNISKKLSEIVKSISNDANTNAEAARKISNSMSAILKINEETKDSTKNTTNSIAEIDKMSRELSESVKTFIVP